MSVPMGAQTGFGNVSEGQGNPGRKRWNPLAGKTPSQIAAMIGMTQEAGIGDTAGGAMYGFGTGGGGGTTVRSPMGQDYGFNNAPYRPTYQQGLSQAEMDALASSGGRQLSAAALNSPFTTASAASVTSDGSKAGVPGGSTSGTDTAAFQFRGSDKAYSPSDIAAMLANPALFQGEYLSGLGINTPTAAGAMGDYYRIIPYLAQFFLAQNTPAGGVSDADRQAGIYEDLLQNYTTPGGRSADLGEILTALFGAGQPGSGELPANMLQANYANMAPDDQIKAVNNLLNAAIAGQPGGYGDALSNLFAQAAMMYQQSNLNANNGSATNNIPNTAYYEWLQTQPIFRQIAGYL